MNESHALLRSLIETLDQGELLLTELSDAAYARREPAAFNASIGGHYRHCLDHFRSVLDAAEAGDLNYDARARDPLLECDRFAALNATRTLRAAVGELPAVLLARSLAVTCKTSYARASAQTAPSTVGREVMYAVAHAVHHYALIGVMAALQGARLPSGFGVAPSTLQHQRELVTC